MTRTLLGAFVIGGGVLAIVMLACFVRALLRFANDSTDEFGGPVTRQRDWYEQ